MADIGERRVLASAPRQLALFGHYPFITGALFREGPILGSVSYSRSIARLENDPYGRGAASSAAASRK